ncbi:RNB domain-containing ribonuclease [Nakamurella silvestris]|nr:RNB domain-containing ribonuclease [Nakamurella silvestris]
MPYRRIIAPSDQVDFEAIRSALGVHVDFPPEVLAEAAELAAAADPHPDRQDLTDVPFVTLDPVGSMDLDQAVHLSARDGGGFRVRYAIADVGSFVPGHGPLHEETLRRGQSFYAPDAVAPLHPTVLSAGAASLLPDQTRRAVLWTIDLDPAGEPVAVGLARALVRSVARLDYESAQQAMESGTLHPSIALLQQVGELRLAASRRREAITLDLPDVEVVTNADGRWTLRNREVLPIEQYNAEISLLTGMSAARIMLDGDLALLRTLPQPDEFQIATLHKSAQALGVDWPAGASPGQVIGGLDPNDPKHAAFLDDAVRLLRGAGYLVWRRGVTDPGTDLGHAGIGSTYAHVTAPLRRLVDRYATEICLSRTAAVPVPAWVLGDLDQLPELMTASNRVASALEKACRGAVAAFLLHGREGGEFKALVLQVDTVKNRAQVLLDEPPVRAKCAADGLAEGDRITVTLVSADPATQTYLVEPV